MPDTTSASQNSKESSGEKILFTTSIRDNISLLKNALNDDDMVVYRSFYDDDNEAAKYCLVFADTLSSEKIINDKIIKPVMNNLLGKRIKKEELADYAINRVIQCRDIKRSTDADMVLRSVLYGDTLFLMDGVDEILIISTKEWVTRSIEEPESEKVVRGPREGFTESIKVNMSLLERKIVNPDFKLKYLEIGKVSKTKVCLCYIEGIASDKIVKEAERRLNGLEIDGVMDSGYIQETIKDAPFSVFTTIGDSERPDIVAAKLMEGRVALICDGSPNVLTMPFIFVEYFQSNEDYYTNYIFASINRILRIMAYFFTISLPAIYLAIVSFHQEMLPTPLILSIAIARKDVPFPTIVELILMLLVFEFMREAGVRLPSPVGMAISIVGALVLGEAAVTAKIISAPIVIITALTGICSFLIFRLKGPVIIIRLLFLVAAAILGLLGYMMAMIGLAVYLVSIRSFGVPYMLNTSLIDMSAVKDVPVRAPMAFMSLRPKFAKNRSRFKTTGVKAK